MANSVRSTLLAIIWLLLGLSSANAKFLTMRPLSAREVYSLLQQSGRSDAIPQGRVITQGLAAMTGFTLGLTKALGGVFLYDIITANVTDLDLNDGKNNETRLTTQEICFNSRNARNLEVAEAIAEAYSNDYRKEQEKEKPKIRPSEVERRLTRKRRNKRKSQSHRRKPSRLVLKKHSLAKATGTQAGTGTNTETTNPTITVTREIAKSPATSVTAEAMPTAGTMESGTNIDNGEGTGTTSTSTTSTGNDGAINCIVIEKPDARRKR